MGKPQYSFLFIVFLLFLSGCEPAPSRRAIKDFDEVDPGGQKVTFYYREGENFQWNWEELFRRFSDENPWGIRVVGETPGDPEELWNELITQGRTGMALFGQNGPAAPPDQGADLFPLYAHPQWGIKGVSPLEEDLPRYLVKQSEWRLPFLPLLRDVDVLYINLDEGRVPEDPQMVWKLPRLAFFPDGRTLFSVSSSLGGEVGKPGGAFSPGKGDWKLGFSFVEEAVARGLAIPERKRYQGQMWFSSGEALASLNALSGLSYYERTIEAFGSDFSWTISSLPTRSSGELALWDVGITILPGAPEEVLASWLFYRWCMEAANQARLVEAAGLLPLNSGAIEHLSVFLGDHPPYGKVFDSYLALPRRVFPRNAKEGALLTRLDEEMASLGNLPDK